MPLTLESDTDMKHHPTKTKKQQSRNTNSKNKSNELTAKETNAKLLFAMYCIYYACYKIFFLPFMARDCCRVSMCGVFCFVAIQCKGENRTFSRFRVDAVLCPLGVNRSGCYFRFSWIEIAWKLTKVFVMRGAKRLGCVQLL
ncbi:hypothetical protein BaRGS_00030630 [Batillaria attramentaria]|uniref:Transmembrane protein n=1 Tax=Batillaria attramentaria TaxID=370345 RepID=A0ABD0JTZ0_9CAEN